jgi:hypothetical protein
LMAGVVMGGLVVVGCGTVVVGVVVVVGAGVVDGTAVDAVAVDGAVVVAVGETVVRVLCAAPHETRVTRSRTMPDEHEARARILFIPVSSIRTQPSSSWYGHYYQWTNQKVAFGHLVHGVLEVFRNPGDPSDNAKTDPRQVGFTIGFPSPK